MSVSSSLNVVLDRELYTDNRTFCWRMHSVVLAFWNGLTQPLNLRHEKGKGFKKAQKSGNLMKLWNKIRF